MCEEEPPNPCTADYCLESSDGFYRCQHFPSADPGCCARDADCPADGVSCTVELCLDGMCQLEHIQNCQVLSPYLMTFTEGHPVYTGEYQNLSDVSWRVLDFGTPASAFYGFDTRGPLGPDRHLAFRPTSTVANYESCALPPRFRVGRAVAALQADIAAEGVTGSGAEIRVWASSDGDWDTASLVASEPFVDDFVAADWTVAIPDELALGHAEVYLAICVAGATTDDLGAFSMDDFVLGWGLVPEMAPVADQSVARGQSTTIRDVFVVTDPDPDQTVRMGWRTAPGSWLQIGNVRQDPADPTGATWLGDLVVDGTQCPLAPPYEYDLTAIASDGVFRASTSFNLSVTGCP